MNKIYKIVFLLSIGLAILSMIFLAIYGLKLGVDFKGGSVLEINFKNRPSTEQIVKNVKISDSELEVTYFGDSGVIIKTRELGENEHQDILGQIQNKFPESGFEEKRFESVGPIIGQELKRKSIIAIIIVLFSIIAYISYVFRKMSRTLSPWTMGVAAVIALAHDIIIPLGIFALLGHFIGIEITAIFVAAVLTILGYSVSDTVVIFDRVRENILKGKSEKTFAGTVHKSIMQTLTRSINTTVTVLLSLFAVYFFGGESIKYFSLMLIIGVFLGAYSSIFVASPLLVWWSERSRGK